MMLPVLFAQWNATTTAVMTGIAGGFIGVVGSSCVALYTKWNSAIQKADMERNAAIQKAEMERNAAVTKADIERVKETLSWDRARGDRLETRVWELEKCFRDCEKEKMEWQTKYQELRSSLPKSGTP